MRLKTAGTSTQAHNLIENLFQTSSHSAVLRESLKFEKFNYALMSGVREREKNENGKKKHSKFLIVATFSNSWDCCCHTREKPRHCSPKVVISHAYETSFSMEISAVPLREPASTPSSVYARAIQTFNNEKQKKISAMCKLSKAKSWMFEEQREWQRRSFNIQFLITFFFSFHIYFLFAFCIPFRQHIFSPSVYCVSFHSTLASAVTSAAVVFLPLKLLRLSSSYGWVDGEV